MPNKSIAGCEVSRSRNSEVVRPALEKAGLLHEQLQGTITKEPFYRIRLFYDPNGFERELLEHCKENVSTKGLTSFDLYVLNLDDVDYSNRDHPFWNIVRSKEIIADIKGKPAILLYDPNEKKDALKLRFAFKGIFDVVAESKVNEDMPKEAIAEKRDKLFEIIKKLTEEGRNLIELPNAQSQGSYSPRKAGMFYGIDPDQPSRCWSGWNV